MLVLNIPISAVGILLASPSIAKLIMPLLVCGNTISNGGGPAPNGISDCNMPCTGNSSEFCGAGERLDMYEQVGGPSTELQHVPSVGAYTWQGCYTDAITSRALTANTLVNYGTMTVEICAAFCAGYTYFGVEYAGECYCGNVLAGGSVLSTTTSCNMLCDGNQLEYCGGPNRLDFYSSKGTHTSASGSTPSATVTPTGPQHVASVGAYTWQGCYTDVVGARTLTGNTLINYNTMTVEICAGYCAGYSYFGVEYSGECYCGNVLENGGAPSTTASCNMLCDGNQLEYCGGPNRLDFYSSKGTPTSPAGTTPTSAVTGPVLPTGWSYSGCYVDNVDARILGYEFEDNNGLTIEFCVNECIAAGYTIAGMEWSVQCFCDDFIVNSGALSADQSDCNMPCGGNANEMCGAGNRMSIYNTGTIKTVAAPAVQVSGLPGSWTYSGCIT
jgi:WSC domain